MFLYELQHGQYFNAVQTIVNTEHIIMTSMANTTTITLTCTQNLHPLENIAIILIRNNNLIFTAEVGNKNFMSTVLRL